MGSLDMLMFACAIFVLTHQSIKEMSSKMQILYPLIFGSAPRSCLIEINPVSDEVIKFTILPRTSDVACRICDFTQNCRFESPRSPFYNSSNDVAWKAKYWTLAVFRKA